MRRIPWWVWVSAAPMGLGAWTPIVPGSELKRRGWTATGAILSAVTIAGWVLAIVHEDDGKGGSGGGLILLGWVGALVATLLIRPTYLREVASPFRLREEQAAQQLKERGEALELAKQNPRLAVELGVGRPDIPGAQDAGLIDVNNAPLSVLRRLPGVNDGLAHRMVELRDQLNGFESLSDCGEVLDLDGHAVERLREHVVFLPR